MWRTGFFVLALPLAAARSSPASEPAAGWVPGGPSSAVTGLAVDSSPEARVYAATPDGVYRSQDHGVTWDLLPGSPPAPSVTLLAIDPDVSRIVGIGCGGVESLDGGDHWYGPTPGLPPDCSFTILDRDLTGGRLYASGPAGIFRSGFGAAGRIWLPFGGSVVPAPAHVGSSLLPDVFAAGADRGIYWSRDAGASWIRTGEAPRGADVRQIRACCAGFLDVATGAGAFFTQDKGASWTAIDPLLEGFGVTELVSAPAGSYAATDRGVYRNTPKPTGFSAWESLSTGLPDGVPIRRIAVDSSGRFLVALPASGTGTYRYEYPPALMRALDVPDHVSIVGTEISIEIDPPQPAAFELRVSSSDPVVLPEMRWPVAAFSKSTTVSLAPRKTSATPVRILISAPEAYGGSGLSLDLPVTNPLPRVAAVYPSQITLGGPAFELAVVDEYRPPTFVEGAVVLWNGSPRPTRRAPATPCPDPIPCPSYLLAEIPAEDIASRGIALVTVVNPIPGGGVSAPVKVRITSAEAPVFCYECVRRPPEDKPRPPR